MNPTGPFDQDKLESFSKSETRPLAEKDFIQESPTGGSWPVWIWIFLVSLIIISIIGTWNWYQNYFQDKKDEKTFSGCDQSAVFCFSLAISVLLKSQCFH